MNLIEFLVYIIMQCNIYRKYIKDLIEIIGVVVRNGKFYYLQKEVNVIFLMVVLDFFLKFFEKYNSVILVGYNIKSFDCLVYYYINWKFN